jgi:hypothetical protein
LNPKLFYSSVGVISPDDFNSFAVPRLRVGEVEIGVYGFDCRLIIPLREEIHHLLIIVVVVAVGRKNRFGLIIKMSFNRQPREQNNASRR